MLYWTEGGADDRSLSYGRDTVRQIYEGVSREALCFLVEAGGVPVGECWLQRMNLPDVTAMYPQGTDVRRIDMMLGEKAFWGRGIGTAMVRMLVEYAWCGERVDVLHCFSEDYNLRSRRVWEKNGFSLALTEDLPQPQKGKFQYHWTLKRSDFIQKRRTAVPPEKIMMLPIEELQPSQLYVSEGKLRLCREWFDGNLARMDAIPVIRLMGRMLMTDGHTRAVAAYLAGARELPCYLDDDELDITAYAMDLAMCCEEGVNSVSDLTSRVVPVKEYEHLWRKRCMELRRRQPEAVLPAGGQRRQG